MTAAPAGTSGNFALGGFDPATNTGYVMYKITGGGYGGNADHDGLTNGCSTIGISKTAPVEVTEQYYPVLFRRFGMHEGSGGAGLHRGGFGVHYEVEILRGEARASFVMDHGRFGPPGVAAAVTARRNIVKIHRGGETFIPEHLSKDQDIVIVAGDRVEVFTPGGGGYGDPLPNVRLRPSIAMWRAATTRLSSSRRWPHWRGGGDAIAYAQPTLYIDALTDLLAHPSQRARVLAGGTDVYPAKATRAGWGHMSHPDVLDISRLDELRGIDRTGDHGASARSPPGAMSSALTLPPAVRWTGRAAREVGGVQIQNRGTIAGNICTASPAGDGAPPLLALDARVEVASRNGVRIVPIAAFVTGYRATRLRPGELVTAILVPKHQGVRAPISSNSVRAAIW